ncbi:amino acid dehydrogenase [Prauserella marina]|uniref:D-amino-acid dehydrogenase n=1 Tax=Prauserella marina TaxID=530584 RepID=A0A222VKS0_9PSEU|nr:FAD-dependent oxidoreductase [Prauserella marina]ASR34487.1 amino acid dehydrogenase [Prauserella marina]PWV85915.1 glycine/D-amino acid oxidase-like deaminating enzyme [Prauserella marina]SDC42423.1 D-amino-acid dehydrogenase [Prauserella marina]
MTGQGWSARGPRTAVVVGAGVLGLSTAWFLQERGVEVTVVDRAGVGAGASWGNAGWLSPALALPLNEPGVLRFGIRSLFDRAAPLHVPMTPNPALWRFLLRFAVRCRWPEWERVAKANLALSGKSLEAFDQLAGAGVDVGAMQAPVTALFENQKGAAGLIGELERLRDVGQDVSYRGLTGSELADWLPQASGRMGAAVRVDGQRYVDPGAFTAALADSVRARGGVIRSGFEVVDVRPRRYAVSVRSASTGSVSAQVVVLATGAWLDGLSRRFGVAVPVRAGRGYSFTVPVDEPVPGPVYLPGIRVACTPYKGALRVAGTMEFRGPDAAMRPARIEAIVASARPFLSGVDWDRRTDEWVGPRPVTHDGKPVIGATAAPGVYVAGGHGMWGLTQGPVSGRLLAEQITTGDPPGELRDFDPLR